jgi:hypothetical protein
VRDRHDFTNKKKTPDKFLFEKTITSLALSFRVFTCNLLFAHTKPPATA